MTGDAKHRQLVVKFEELRTAIRRLCPDSERARKATQKLNLAEMEIFDAFERKRTDYDDYPPLARKAD